MPDVRAPLTEKKRTALEKGGKSRKARHGG